MYFGASSTHTQPKGAGSHTHIHKSQKLLAWAKKQKRVERILLGELRAENINTLMCSHYEAGFENLVPKGTLVERAPNPIMISQQLYRATNGAGEARCWLWKRAAGAYMRAYIYTKSILSGSKRVTMPYWYAWENASR